MADKKIEQVNEASVYESEEIRRLNESIDQMYSTSGQTLPALVVSEVLDPAKIELAQKAYEQMVNPDPQDDDIMDEAGTTRKQLRDMYVFGIPAPSVAGLDNSEPTKHTIDVRVENGKAVIEVNSNREGEEAVIISEPPSNNSPAEGSSTDLSAVTAPVATTAFPSERELEANARIMEVSSEQQTAADVAKMQVSQENKTRIGTDSPTVAPSPNLNRTTTSPTATVETNVETKSENK